MSNIGLVRRADDADFEAVRVGAPHMSKSERLHRWADDLELHGAQPLQAVGDAASGAEGGWWSARADGSPLSVAFEDWAFQAEGLQGDRVGDALAFFDLSEDEMQAIIGSSGYGGRTIPAAVAAERVRALAEQAGGATLPHVGILVAGASVAAVLGVALLTS